MGDGIAARRKRVLVFGTGSTARILGERLTARGMAVEFASATQLPDPNTPDATIKLRKILTEFIQQAPEATCFAHPATHVWSLRPELPQLGMELGIVMLTPPAPIIALFANRLTLLTAAEKLGIPNLVLTFDPFYSVRELERFMSEKKLSCPIVLKSVRPAGPFGSRLLQGAGMNGLESELALWMEQLRRRSGELMIYPERYLDDARQATVSFARFANGAKHIFPFVDSSLQARGHELVQLCPAENLDPRVEAQIRTWILRMADEWRFVGVGSFHFQIEGDKAFLIDGRARLESGFQLWEKIEGTDAVGWQLAAARFTPEPPKSKPESKGQSGALLRILAEDPILQLPQPGVIHEVSGKRSWEFPGASGELHVNYGPGDLVSSQGGPVIAQLLAVGQDTRQAMAIARGILAETWISGSIQTNERFLSELLTHPWVREGMFHRGFLDEEFIPGIRPDPELLKIMGSLPLAHPEIRKLIEQGPQGRWAAGDQWVQPDPSRIQWELSPEPWGKEGLFGISGSLQKTDGQKLRVSAYPVLPMPGGKWQVRLGQWFMSVRHIIRTGQNPQALALVSGRVHAILFRAGAIVPAHEPFLITESLGYLVPHASPRDLRIHAWKVQAEQRVSAGEPLAEVSFSNSPA